MTHSNAPTEAPLIVWPCYEPAGHRIELTEADLVQHVLLIGSTGSGKSTLLTAATSQLILHNAQRSEDKIGLLVIDAKADDIVSRVRKVAQRAGRKDDVLVFGPDGDHSFDLFGALRSLNDVERMTRRVLLATDPVGGDNAFWQTTTVNMFSAAFTLLVAAKQPVSFGPVVDFLRRWFLSPTTPPDVQEIARRLSKGGRKGHPLIAGALDQVSLWNSLDPRTRSNLQSCLVNVLRPLLSPAAVRSFAPCSQPFGSPSQAASEGKLCVVSVNALAEPELAKFFFRLAKQSYFESVQRRSGNQNRLSGMVADEFPLVVTREDVEQLATIRSKRCFVLAATQGLNALSERLGVGQSHALVNNCNTLVFMRSREAETAVHAFVTLGTRQKEKRRQKPSEEGGFLGLLPPPLDEPIVTELPVCPIGALGQLDAHQAYLVFPNGSKTAFPVWFAPWFELPETKDAVEETAISTTFSSAHVQNLMTRVGFRPIFSPHIVAAASAVWSPRKGNALERAREFFRGRCCQNPPDGLNQLPACWLAALPGILWGLRKPGWTHLPLFIDRMAMQDGVLLVSFAQEQPIAGKKLTIWDKIRILINASLYPSRWRPLSRRHVVALCQAWPDLRPTLNPESPTLT
jgi:energy-coupling factor transporter ATP-binding protein EcfA2